MNEDDEKPDGVPLQPPPPPPPEKVPEPQGKRRDSRRPIKDDRHGMIVDRKIGSASHSAQAPRVMPTMLILT